MADAQNTDQIPPEQRLQETLSRYEEQGVRQVKLGLTDIDGVIRGKYVGLSKFASLLSKQGGFCDCVFGWDMDDQLYEAGDYTGWHSGFPDTGYRLQVDTERWLAEEGCPYFIAEFVERDDSDHPLCPRTRLRSVLQRMGARGLTVRAGFEYEFFVFNETPHSIRDKGYRNLTPITPETLAIQCCVRRPWRLNFRSSWIIAQIFNASLKACTVKPGRVFGKPLWFRRRVWRQQTERRCSKPWPRVTFNGGTCWQPLWLSGRWTTRVKAVIYI